MTHEQYVEQILKMVADLKAQGKNPHGELRDAWIDICLEKMEK